MTSDRFPIAAVATKRIYGEVSARDFDQFMQRARAEGLRMGEAMNAIAAAYAHGDFYILAKDKAKQQSINYYLEAHTKQA